VSEIVSNQAVTLRMVAAHAGVSKSVVSRVLQGSQHVSDQRRAAVERSIEVLGYRPNGTARNLSTRRTRAVGVLINDLHQPWFVDFLEGLNPTLHTFNLHAFAGDGRLDRSTDERLLHAFIDMRVDGLVLAGTMPFSATIGEAARRIPTVVAGSRDFQLDYTDVIAPDDSVGVQLALNHLRELGHARIAHLAGTSARVFDLRRTAYEEWMDTAGLSPSRRVEGCDTTEAGGYEAAIKLLDVEPHERPTAIFAATDLSCIGALSAADELGLDVPGDVSFVGFDNTYLARMGRISLTSVDAAAHQGGVLAAQRLVERIAEPSAPSTETLMPPQLEIRRTTAPPRS
jgi:DNA-binding LacI/PurR family transcriptional regulator